ncbi:MAG TPA: hypothetical protein VK338_06250 [Candidatus Nitrosocosmicus sp.]|nr:hypothetical protein [Candidatus Nitrosocosmicus sp.]
MTSYADQPCERCGSPKRVSKTWTEFSPNIVGKTNVECSQIVCTNDECQAKFNSNLRKDTIKRNKIKRNKIANDLARKNNAIQMRANKAKL